jgi:hypothetical protein
MLGRPKGVEPLATKGRSRDVAKRPGEVLVNRAMVYGLPAVLGLAARRKFEERPLRGAKSEYEIAAQVGAFA